MLALSAGTIEEYLKDDHIGGLYVQFDVADGGYKLGNTDIVSESLELEESLMSGDAFKLNTANASAIKFDVFKSSPIGNMDIVGKWFTAYHYVRTAQDDPVFVHANSLFGGDRLSNNAERLKPYVEQAINQLENQDLERYYGHGPKVFSYNYEWETYVNKGRKWDPEAQEYYIIWEKQIRQRTGTYTYITPNTMIDGGQLYFKINEHRNYLWGNVDVDITASIDSRTNQVVAVLPPTYQNQQISIVTPVTYKASYSPSYNFKPVNKPGRYVLDLNLIILNTDTEPYDDESYRLTIRQYNSNASVISGAESVVLTIPEGGSLQTQTLINMDANCASLKATISGKNGSVDASDVESDGEHFDTTCNIYPVELLPLGVFKVESCPVVVDKNNTRTVKAYDKLYSKALDEKIDILSSSVSSIGDVLDTYVTPATDIQFGGEKYTISRDVTFVNSFDDVTYTAAFPGGTLTETVVISTGRFSIENYSSGLSYEFVKKTFEDASFSTRIIYDLEEKYGIRQLVSMWNADGSNNPQFNHDWYTAYAAIRNAIASTNFSEPSAIDSNGRFTISIVKSVTITTTTEGSSRKEVVARKGTSAGGTINMADPIVPLVTDLNYQPRDRKYIDEGLFYINTGKPEPEIVAEGGSLKKGGTRFYYHLIANPATSIFSSQQSFTFQGTWDQPVTVAYAVAKYKICVAIDDQSVYWQFPAGDYMEMKVKDYPKGIADRVIAEIRQALFKGNILDGQGNVYNSSDSSVLSNLENFIKSNCSASDIRINGGDGQPFPNSTAVYNFMTPLAYYITKEVTSAPSGQSEVVENRQCDVSNMLEQHNTNTLYEKALSSGVSFTTTPRELIGAYAELNGMFFNVDRYGNPQLVELKSFIPVGGAGYPSDNLFPAEDIYPGEDSNSRTNNQLFVTNDSIVEINYKRTADPVKFKGVRIYKGGVMVREVNFSHYPPWPDINERIYYELRDNPFIENYDMSLSDYDEIGNKIGAILTEIEVYNANAKVVGLPFMTLGDIAACEYNETAVYIMSRRLKGVTALYDELKVSYES